MIIAVAGPYSAYTEEEREKNLNKLNMVSLQLLQMGHTPIVGVNAALPIIKNLPEEKKYESIMKISMAVITNCEAILIIKESLGAIKERDYFLSKGLPVYTNIDDIPAI